MNFCEPPHAVGIRKAKCLDLTPLPQTSGRSEKGYWPRETKVFHETFHEVNGPNVPPQ